MAESTELRDNIVTKAEQRPAADASPSAWGKIKLVVRRSFFWSYERGTWQYDLIVAAILAFIFLTPRSWFQKAPTLGMVDLRHVQGVVEVSHDKERRTYMVDARLVQSRAPEAPEDAIRDILQERLHKQYRVLSIETVQDKNSVILGYRVLVAQ